MADSRKRSGMLGLCAAGLAALLTLACLEAVLHLFPVQSYIPYQPVNAENPVARYRPNRTFVYSSHWNFQDVNYGSTNAQGFVSDFDYDPEDSRPLIAVVGDSYVEARMVPFAQTMQERIRAGTSADMRVYAFAMSGAPLSQYLMFAQLAHDVYRPDALVVVIVSNDFDESFAAYHTNDRLHYFTEDAQGNLYPRLLSDYQTTWLRELISHSALVRYAYFHLRITDAPRTIARAVRPMRRTTRASPATTERTLQRQSPPDTRTALSLRGAEAFLTLLPEYAGLASDSIILVLDGHRHLIYRNRPVPDNYFETMRRYVLTHGARMGYTVIDMHPVFQQDYDAHGQRFDFLHDAHWNARAHALAGREVLMSLPLQPFVDNPT